jgi:hypothetical protein
MSEEAHVEQPIALGGDSISLTDSVTGIRTWTSLRMHRLNAAIHFTKSLRDIESTYGAGQDQPELHRILFISAITEAAAFMETSVNELLSQVRDEIPSEFPNGLTEEKKGSLTDYFTSKRVRQDSTLDKVNKILQTKELPGFHETEVVYEQAKLVTWLRNSFMHYKPEWLDVSGEDDTFHELDKVMRGNPYVDKETPFFPTRCMSYECAKWALGATVAFIDLFNERIGLTDRYTGYMGDI